MKPSDKKEILRQNVSRRSFLKRAAVGAAAVSGANLQETKTDATEKIEAKVMEKDSYPATNSAPAKANFSTTLSSATISENDGIVKFLAIAGVFLVEPIACNSCVAAFLKRQCS